MERTDNFERESGKTEDRRRKLEARSWKMEAGRQESGQSQFSVSGNSKK